LYESTGIYDVTLVPDDATELELVLVARTQWRANRFETCLATDSNRAWSVSADGRDELAQTPPRDGTVSREAQRVLALRRARQRGRYLRTSFLG
jgi:hypothetical protein